MNPVPATPPPRSFLRHPRFLLLGIVLTGLIVFTLFPRVQTKLGLYDYGRWFLDTYAILATNDAIREGMDPWAPNPLDDLERQHSYTHWWFALGPLGLTRADNFLLGGLFVLAFLGTALGALRPRCPQEAVLQALVLLSPPVLLAIMRANNDLLVFALLATGLLAARPQATWRLLAVLATVALATGLKFYPAVAVTGLLLVRPLRRFRWGVLIAGLVLSLVVADVWTDFGRAVIPVPTKVYSFGALVLLRDLGWEGRAAPVPAAGVLLLLGLLFRQRGFTRGLTQADDGFPVRLGALMAIALITACFLAGISYAYRWVFTLWLVPWLWDGAWGAAGPQRTGSRLALGLLLLSVWADGLFCLTVNLIIGPMSPQGRDHLQLCWRLLSQPVIWLLMAMLTGWLLDAALATWGDWRKESRPAPAP